MAERIYEIQKELEEKRKRRLQQQMRVNPIGRLQGKRDVKNNLKK